MKLPREKFTAVYNLIDGLNDVFVNMIKVIMKAMPFFVFALMAGQVVDVGDSCPDPIITPIQGKYKTFL